MLRTIRTAAQRHDAQTMVEYVVVLGVITIAIVTSIGALSTAVTGLFEQAAGVFS